MWATNNVALPCHNHTKTHHTNTYLCGNHVQDVTDMQTQSIWHINYYYINQLPHSYTFIQSNVIILTSLKTVVQTSNKKINNKFDWILENLPSTHKWTNWNLWLCTPVALSHKPTKFIFAMVLIIEATPSKYTALFTWSCNSTLVKYE